MPAPASADSSASDAAISINSRKVDTKALSMESRTAARCDGWSATTESSSAPVILTNWRSVAARTSLESPTRSRRGSMFVANVRDITTPNTATASNPATRATALLIPDATPECERSTAFMTVVVSGATTIAMPMPRIVTAGKNVVQYEPPTPGRAYSANPSAAIKGPTVSGSRLPTRVTKPPDHRPSTNMITGNGSSAAPAFVAE